VTLQERTNKMCPSPSGGNNFWPTSYSAKTSKVYISALTVCGDLTLRPELSNKQGDWKGGSYKVSERWESQVSIADPLTGETKKKVAIPYANYSGNLTTAGGLMLTGFNDGTFIAFDDETLDQLWKINVGTGFNAPPMTFEVNGKQYIGVLSGLSAIARGKNANSPELKEQRNQTLLWVFSL
jgi:alcohol dehydrogenase (cytochrome c)